MVNVKRDFLKAVMSFMVVLTVLFSVASPMVVEASAATVDVFSGEVKTELESAHPDAEYELADGGHCKASDIMVQENGVWKINEAVWGQLTDAAKTQFMSDLNQAANDTVDKNPANYNDQSITNWYNILQKQDGVGSKFLSVILENTKPDFVTANKIYKPFSGIVGVVLGLASVLIIALLGVVMAADIAYISLPPFRLIVGEGGGREGGRKVASAIITFDAIYAVKESEEHNAGGGSPKFALGIYFKRRVFTLIILGICLMYLISGQIYTLVGWILNLVSGFLGF